jgi:hypothetical protein
MANGKFYKPAKDLFFIRVCCIELYHSENRAAVPLRVKITKVKTTIRIGACVHTVYEQSISLQKIKTLTKQKWV